MAIFSKENLSAARLGKILGFSLAPSLVIFFYFELQIIDISGFLVGLFIYTFLAGHLFGSVEVRTVIEKVTESTYQDVTTEKNLDKLNNEIEDLSKLINDVIERVIAFSKDQEGQEKGLQTLLNLHGELIKIDMENAESNYGDLIKKVEKGTSKFLKRIRDMEEFSGLISGNSTERGVFIKLIQEKVGLISKESGHSGKALQDILNAVDKVESDISGFMDYTTETIELVKKGRNLFLQTAEYIHQIKQGLTGSAEIIKNLNQKSIEIGQIVNVIENISDKTKLLALNAKIMAAQAGANGRGFSVVADEMTSLSENTIRSTKDIEALISSLQHEAKVILDALQEDITRVNAGVAYSDKASDALTDIYRASINSKKMTKKIKQSIRDQEKYSGMVKDDFNKMDNIVQNVSKFIIDGTEKELEYSGSIDKTFGSLKEMLEAAQKNQRQTSELLNFLQSFQSILKPFQSIPDLHGSKVDGEIDDLKREISNVADRLDKMKMWVN